LSPKKVAHLLLRCTVSGQHPKLLEGPLQFFKPKPRRLFKKKSKPTQELSQQWHTRSCQPCPPATKTQQRPQQQHQFHKCPRTRPLPNSKQKQRKKPKRPSRRRQQRFRQRRQQQSKVATHQYNDFLQSQIQQEWQRYHHKLQQAEETVRQKLVQAYGFAADPDKTPNHNASIYLAQTPTWYYFNRPHNFAFHDLTTTIKPPPNLRTLLGNSLKFIPTPRYTTTQTQLHTSTLSRLSRDLDIKMYFVGDAIDTDDFDSKLYTRSHWTPPPWGISLELQARVQTFSRQLHASFQKKRGK
jgi:hypothetical protein